MEYREATLEDAELLYRWRTESTAASNSLNQEYFSLDSHRQWLSGVIGNSDRNLLLFHEGGTPLGMGRADYSDGSYTLSWSVDAAARGQGMGLKIVTTLIEKFSPCEAWIKEGNLPSLRIVEKLGFTKARESDGVWVYRWEEE